MRSMLSKIAIRKAVGVYLGEHEVAVVKAAATPVGPVQIASSSEPCTPENMAEVIERLLVPLLGRRHHVPVAVGVPSYKLFFGTRPTSTGGAATPEAVLQKALSSSNISADDLVVDLLRGNVNKMPVATVAACRKRYMANVVATLSRLGVRPVRTEPSPCALVRLAAQQHRFPRRSKLVLCVFLNAAHGMVLLVSGGLPLAWKTLALPAGAEGFAILSAARTMQTQHKHYGIESSPDFVIIHGRADLHERLRQEQFPANVGTRVVWHEGPALDGSATALGLALGCLAQDIKAFDLSRSLKARAPIKEIFPWKELGFAAGLMGLMGVVLGAHAMKLDESHVGLRAENSQHVCLASAEPAGLEKDRKETEAKIKAVRNFVESRVLWTAYIRDISERLPPHAKLSVFTARNPLNRTAKALPVPGSFEVRGTAPLSQDGSIPHDIDAFLGAVAKDPRWKRDFASVTTDIKLPLVSKKDKKERSEVDFTILGVCKSSGAASSSKGKGKNEQANKEEKGSRKDEQASKEEK